MTNPTNTLDQLVRSVLDKRNWRLLLAFAGVGCVVGCSGTPTPLGEVGGGSAIGGASAVGGVNGSGGSSTGGASVSVGGAPTGGAATGGKTSAGGSSTSGGASATGGNAAAGGGTGTAKSAGCGKTSTLTFGSVPNESASAAPGSGNGVGFGTGGYLTIQSSGQSRGFAVRLPDNYDNTKPYWLIFGFHWNGGNSAQVDNGGTSGYDWSYYGLQKASKNGAIFVAPDGLNAGWANSGGHDLTFTDDMVKLIEDNYCVDTTHIISTGFSYGGGMSYEIACARAKVFRAVAIFEGAQLSGCDGGNDPIALWQMVGTADTTCTEAMATPLRDRFVKNNACTVQNPPQPANGSLTHICTNYSGCSVGHPVRWCVHGSGHTPAPIDGSSSLYGPGGSSWVPGDLWPWLTSL
jgi:poly(3-hydroxybutyrate) depolymerase